MNEVEAQSFISRKTSTHNRSEKNRQEIIQDIECGWKFWKKRRYVVGILVFIGYFITFVLRVNLSVALVVMTTSTKDVKAEFEWDSKTRGLVLSSFFYGYFCTQFIGGWLSVKLGGKKILGIGIFVTALLTMITPPLTRISVYLLIGLRVVEGIFEGTSFPCSHAIWANWAPPMERSKLASLAFSGSFSGAVFSMPLSGLIADNLGWPAVFYICGLFGVVWFALWWYLVTDKPEDDPWISASELGYITQSLNYSKEERNASHPWKAMLTSAPVWGIIAAQFCDNWGHHTMVTQLPTFMNDVLNFKIEKAGFFSALPYLGEATFTIVSSHLADYLRTNKYLTTTQVRKLFTSISFLGQMVSLISASYLKSSVAVIGCITFGLSMGGFGMSGYEVNFLDIAPQHAGVLMGIGNTIATIPGIISPSLSGYIVKNKSAAEWRIVFIIVGCIHLIGVIIYGIFASGEKQKWTMDSNKHRPKNQYDKRENTSVDKL